MKISIQAKEGPHPGYNGDFSIGALLAFKIYIQN